MKSNTTITEKEHKKPEWVKLKRFRKSCFKMQDVCYTDIARELHRSDRTISTIVNLFPDKKSRRIQEYIAERLKTPYKDLWGTDPHHNKTIVTKVKKVVND